MKIPIICEKLRGQPNLDYSIEVPEQGDIGGQQIIYLNEQQP